MTVSLSTFSLPAANRSTPSTDRRLTGNWSGIGLAVALMCAGTASQAQSLSALYESARGFDATYQAAKSAYDAAQAKADQARAGLLPTVGLNSSAS